jgi:hypothetical protein
MAEVKMKWRPVFGSNCPDPALLQTGDLLFPRKPDLTEQAFGWGTYWAKMLDDDPRLADDGGRFARTIGSILEGGGASAFVSPSREPAKDDKGISLTGYTPDPTRAWLHRPPSSESLQTFSGSVASTPPNFGSLLQDPDALTHPMAPPNLASLSGGFPGPEDPDFLMAIKAVLEITFPQLLNGWLDMTVAEFVKHKIHTFLIDALTSPDVRLSFFVGHVGIVLREENGHSVDEGGNVYVIEANITDYSHYRVAIHPYYVGSDSSPANTLSSSEAKEASQKMRGWVNRRCALGEYVWCARPEGLSIGNWKDQLVQKSKAYLGRPFGFFDRPTFGDDDRMYCAEYVWRVFNDIGKTYASALQDKQTWGSMERYLGVSGQKQQQNLVSDIKRGQGFADSKPFFVLPPALLWNSGALNRLSNPGYALTEPYAPTF